MENYKKTRLFLRDNHPSNFLLNQYAYLMYQKIWKDNYYFQSNKLNVHNENFDKFPNELNTPETYSHIDEFTKKVLEIKF